MTLPNTAPLGGIFTFLWSVVVKIVVKRPFYYNCKICKNPTTCMVMGFSVVAGTGFEPRDLRVMSSKEGVLYRFANSYKVLILCGL